MGLQSAMTTALTGLQAAETQIDVIGNNVANSNTVGFKASEVIFATQFLQTQSIGSAPSDTNGGTNPRQIGLGVKVASITPDFNQGTIEISSNSLDLAIQGDGFLIVQGSQQQPQYTRNGQLTLNSENEIVTSTGNKLLGYGLEPGTFDLDTASPQPLSIPLGGERVAEATSEATFQGVLNPTVQQGTVPAISESEVFGDASVGRPESNDTTPIGIDNSGVFQDPSPPTSAAVGGGSLVAGTYRYRVTVLDSNGFPSTASSEIQEVVDGAATTAIDLSGLPYIGPPDNWEGDVQVYRMGPLDADFQLLATVSGTTYTDDGSVNDGSGPLATSALVDSSLDDGTYTYHVTFIDSSGDETAPSNAIGPRPINGGGAIRLDFSNLDVPADANYTQMRIYRNSSSDSSTFQLLDQLPAPNQGAFEDSYVDKTPDSGLGSDTLDFDGLRAQGTTLLTDLQVFDGSAYTTPFEVGTLSFQGEVGGSASTQLQLDVTTTTTVSDLMNFMSDALGLQQTSNVTGPGNDLPGNDSSEEEFAIAGGMISITPDGVIQVVSNYGEQNAVEIPLTAFRQTPASTGVPETVDVTFSETQDANGPGTATEFLVYDSLGSPLTVRLTTVLEDANSNSTTYRWYATSGNSQPGGTDQTIEIGNGLLTFDSSGNLLSAPSNRLSIFRELTASESPLEVELDFSQVTSLSETNSSGDAISSLSMVRQDGFPPGVLTDFIITESGLIQGQFSNGTQRTLGQVLMARFANNQGLRQVGNSLYEASVNSGDAFVSTPGEDGIGQITAGAVELSNTDIGQDLVEMILAQTQYQAGSRVISTAQELLDELLALQR